MIEKCKTNLLAFLEEPTKFFEIVKETLPYIEDLEFDSEKKEDNPTGLGSVEWGAIIKNLDKHLEKHLLQLVIEQTSLGSLDSTSLANIDLILTFCEKYFDRTKGHVQREFVNSLAKFLMLDNWKLIIRALTIMKYYAERTRTRRKDTPDYLTKENEEWLVNIALGNNLKNNKKKSFLDSLKEKNSDSIFQYFSSAHKNEKEAISPKIIQEEAPALRTIRLEQINEMPEDSSTIAKNLAKKSDLPKELFPALWCKIRLAKTASNDEAKYLSVLASLFSCYILCKVVLNIFCIVTEVTDETQAKEFLSQVELKTRLIPDLIQLLKNKAVNCEMHIAAIEILSALSDIKGSFRSAIGEAGNELGDEVLHQLGVTTTHSGLLEGMLRDATSIQVIKQKQEPEYQVRSVAGGTEILSTTTAENPVLLSSLLKLLKCILKSTIKEEGRNQESSRFWNGVRPPLMNMLQLPIEGKCYTHDVSLTNKAMKILISLKQSPEQDVANIDLILSRLSFELLNLGMDNGKFCYPQPSSYPLLKCISLPKLEHRQELCNTLVSLLCSNININNRRGYEIPEDAILEEELRLRGEIERSMGMRVGRVRRDRRREEVVALQEARRASQHRGSPQIEPEEDKEEYVQHGEAVAVSRRVIESSVINVLTGIFKGLNESKSDQFKAIIGPVLLSSLWLISSVIRDIPACVPDLIQRSLIPNLILNLNHEIIPDQNYFFIILSLLTSITLHPEGCAAIKSTKIARNLIFTLVQPQFGKFFFGGKKKKYSIEEAAKHLMSLYSQASDLRSDIVCGIRDLFKHLNSNSRDLLQRLGILSTKVEKQNEKKVSAELKAEREKSQKQCEEYRMTMKNVFNLLNVLVKSVESREHVKLFDAINQNNELIKQTLELSKIAGMFKVAGNNRLNIESFHTTLLIKFYVSHANREEFAGTAKSVIMNAVSLTIKDLSIFLDNAKKGISLGDYLTGKKKLEFPKTSTELHPNFPPEEQILIELNKIDWICKILKVMKKSFSSDCEQLMVFVSQFHLFLTKEIMRIFGENYDPSSSDSTNSEINELMIKMNEHEDSEISRIINMIIADSFHTTYEKSLFNLYDKVKKTFSEIALSTLKSLSRYDFDPSTPPMEVLKCLGKCAVIFSEEFKKGGLCLKEMKLENGNLKENLIMINHNIMLFENMKTALYNEFLSSDQIFEFYKNGGFENIHGVYQSTVDLICQLRNPAKSALNDTLKILATLIIKVYTTIMKPSNLKTLTSSIMSRTIQAELGKEGFKGTDHFVATLLAAVVENLIFRTNYGEYKSAVKFLAECVQPAFKILIEVLKSYPRKETIEALIQGSRSDYHNWRRRHEIEVPVSMIESLLTMGFEPGESEEALRRHDLNVEEAISELFRNRENNNPYSAPVIRPPPLKNRKIDPKELPKEIEGWIDVFLSTMYEALYSISTYNCKYLLYSLSEFQESHRPYKIKSAFILLLNELHTLLSSIELSYQPTLTPNDEFPISELSEVSMTEKFKNKLKKYTAVEGGITENEFTVLHKMSALIDVISTFLRLSKTNELLNIMCKNRIAQCLIEVLAKLVQKELILPGRKLLPKILVLLTMMYKEVHQTYQGEIFEQSMQVLTGEESKSAESAPKPKASDLLPTPEDVSRLLGFLCKLIDSDKSETNILNALKFQLGKQKKQSALITSELITAVVLLLCHLTKNHINAHIVVQSGIVEKILVLKQVPNCREKLPTGLITELVFNLMESPELLEKYMERIIKSTLFAKTQWLCKNNPMPQNEDELAALQKQSAIEMDQFLGSMSFLMARSTPVFFQACNKAAILRKEMQKDSQNKMVAKFYIVLKMDCLKEILIDFTVSIPNIPHCINNKFLKGKEGKIYYDLIERGINENCEIMKKAISGIANQLVDRLVIIHFERKEHLNKLMEGEKDDNQNNYLISETILIEIIGQIVRIYPEFLASLLIFKSSNPKVCGNTLISFLLSSVLPLKYIQEQNTGLNVERDEEWRNKTVQLIKYLTFENKNLHQIKHRILITEMRKRIVSENIRILKHASNFESITDEPTKLKNLAESFNSLTILEGLLLTEGNTVTFPKENQYAIIKEILQSKYKSILKLCGKIIQNCNLHSGQSQILISCAVNLLERITRFNNLGKKLKPDLIVEPVKPKEEDLALKEVEIYNAVYMEGDEKMVDSDDEKDTSEQQDIDEFPEEEMPPLAVEGGKAVAEEKKQAEENLDSNLFREQENDSFEQEYEGQPNDILEELRRQHLIAGDDSDEEDEWIQERRRLPQRAKQKKKPNKNVELDAVQVRINGDALDCGKNKDVKYGLGALYERESSGNTNTEIMKHIRGDILGEEKQASQSHSNREFSRYRLGLDHFMDRNIFMRGEEGEEERKEELPAISLFGYMMDKRKMSELLKNQLIGKLETQVIMPEEPKKEVPPPEKKVEEKKEEKKEENKKEEKKVEPGPAAPENKQEERKSEEKKEEAKNQEQLRLEQELTQALIARRRQELSQLVPDVRIEDDNLILQIDPEFLMALSPEMRRQSIQSLMTQQRRQNNPQQRDNVERGPAELDPATFIATIADETIRDEILITAQPEFIAALPPNLIARAESLRARANYGRRRPRGEEGAGPSIYNEIKPKSDDPLEENMLVKDKGDSAESEIIKLISGQTNSIDDPLIECLVKLLYIKGQKPIPINALFAHICKSKKHLNKILEILLFILSKHSSYEQLFQAKLTSQNLAECVSETKLLDIYFPPICLYRGMEFNHLTYSVVSLRIFSLLDSLLDSPHVCKYFFLPISQIRGSTTLKSLNTLMEQLGRGATENDGSTPLTELLCLTNNPIYKTSETHLETVINFITKLFSKYEATAKTGQQTELPIITNTNVKQICQIFYFDVMSETSCMKLANVLMKLSKVEANAVTISNEIDRMLDVIGAEACKEWTFEIKQLESEMGVLPAHGIEEDRVDESRVEIRFGLILKLIKRIYDGHSTKKQEEASMKTIKLCVTEGDTIEDSPLISKKQDTVPASPNEKLSYIIRKSILEIFKKDSLTQTLNVLTDLLSVISKKSPRNDSAARKSQLLLKLLPSIESLIITYDNLFKDPTEASELLGQIKAIRESKKERRAELGEKYKRAYIFYKFLDQNHKAFNNLIRQMPEKNFQVVIKPFLMRFPSLLDFENKRNYFRHELRKLRGRDGGNTLRVAVNRNSIFQDSYNQLAGLPVEDMKGRIRVSFKDEDAADAGGVTREWYTTLSKAMFNPLIGLFIKSAHGNTYQPDPKSIIQQNYFGFFKFIGRIIGKALLDGQYLDCYFTRALYKTLVGQPLTIQDMADNDPELYKGLCWLKENDATALGCTFTYTWDYFGDVQTKELIPNGKNTLVTNENKHLFIMKNCKAKLYEEIKTQIESLLSGIYELIPKEKLSIFDYREIELMISGLPDVDVIDLKKNTEYSNYTENSKVIVWFWEIMETFTPKERAEFLQFVTGTSKVPLDGFKSLPGSSGIQRFNIHKVYGEAERLPTAHTW